MGASLRGSLPRVEVGSTGLLRFVSVLARTSLLVVLTSWSAWGAEPAKAEEEVDLDALVAAEATPSKTAKATPTRVPEHDYDRRLMIFPALLVLILAWNVKWKPDPPPTARPPR